MVQITSVIVAVMVAVIPVAQADDWHCRQGWFYCGHTLNHHPSYLNKTSEAIRKLGHGEPTTHDLNHNLFYCTSNGALGDMRLCLECLDKGEGKNDTCSEMMYPIY
ncbi:hypothetical protein E4U30_004556 [Claviceps sp. LM220 group G6]|nr:hypothetical protein E4U15_008007 [Claviceps sp. LM218 group G6]KAG6093207.1 hypothetical protein E4U30_004556 [Claviceps sp. LM220 group G6]KAG6111530.1 hypothetical protein E4U14_002449 [Claviceps sp. LM454 group G7]KAG6114626.1 hypothetical protein E4U31_002318 [Claviceps sp. LM219 group G6]